MSLFTIEKNTDDSVPSSLDHKAPIFKTYSTLEDMLYDSDTDTEEHMAEDVPDPPITIDKIQDTSELLIYIDYIKKYKLYSSNKNYKYIIKAEEPLKELNGITGMKKLKKSVIKQIIFYTKQLVKNNGTLSADQGVYLNTGIYGPPGCGKTTVAKIIGQIYLKLGVVKTDKFIMGRRDNMIGRYLGQTAPKTREVLEQAKDGVLFLDEVYQFGSGKDGNRDSYAKEVVDTINQYITDNPGRIIIIVAGYRKEVKECFFAQNPGLERRFRWNYTIDPYNASELLEIFTNQATRTGYKLAETAITPEFFVEHAKLFEYGGGDTETFLEKCKMAHEQRTTACPKEEGTITKEDINSGFAEYQEYVDDRGNDGDDLKYPHMYI